MAKQSFRVRLREPLILDRRFDFGYALLWFVVAVWGICEALGELTRVRLVTSFDFNLVWGGAIALWAFVAGLTAFSMVLFHSSVKVRVIRKCVEFVAVCFLIAGIIIYPITALFQFCAQPSFDNFTGVAIGTFLVMVPYWRFVSLLNRIKALHILQKMNSDAS